MEGIVTYKSITKEQAKDSGLALVLILLLVSYFLKSWDSTGLAAIIILVITMAAPLVFKPFAVIWLSFSGVLGSFMSKVLLTVVFILVVTPIGWFRRILGKDPMLKKKWKQGSASVFTKRDRMYTADDLEKPY